MLLQSLLSIGFLSILEILLSIDNALVLALLAKEVQPSEQKKVLTYGLMGALIFRLIAVGIAGTLIKFRWMKWLGGGYLLWLAVDYFWSQRKNGSNKKNKTIKTYRGFWRTVLVVELTDISFAVD